jgi:hypothetical protein
MITKAASLLSDHHTRTDCVPSSGLGVVPFNEVLSAAVLPPSKGIWRMPGGHPDDGLNLSPFTQECSLLASTQG